MFKRTALKRLNDWRFSTNRKPLVLRGARQVGKTTLIQEFAQSFAQKIMLNLEKVEHKQMLEASKPFSEILNRLFFQFNIPQNNLPTLLFIDEIQNSPKTVALLRFFYEEAPWLYVIAAGSLLEFALQELPSFGVGRIRSLFVRPFSFNEFLLACNQNQLAEAIQNASETNPLPDLIHKKIITSYKRFMAIGGMPEVVASYAATNDMLLCMNIIDDLVISYQDDFAKYKRLMPANRIKEAFEATVMQMGGKFVYSKAALTSDPKQIKAAIELLILAGLVIPVTHTSSNGIPLGAEIDTKKRKMLIFDTGVFQRLLGLNIGELMIGDSFEVINKGALAELSVGLELSKLSAFYRNEPLYYWQRESVSGNAEIDYVFQKGEKIIPIEVKSSTKGSMQSLHQFMKEKKSEEGIRFSLENFGRYQNIRTIPLYAVSLINQ